MESPSVFEFVVRPPAGYRKLRNRKIRLIVFYCAFCLIMAALAVFVIPTEFLIMTVIVTAALCGTAVVFTWRKTKPEYEYSIVSGELTLSVIYAGRSRRTLLVTELRDAELVAPTNGLYDSKLRDFAPAVTYSGVFEASQANYFMLFRNDGDEKSVLYFYATAEAVKVFRRYNGRTVVSTDLLK